MSSPPFRSLSACVIAVALLSASASAWAQQGRGGHRDEPRQERERGDESLSDAVRRIERTNRGQVLSAERMQSDGRDVNRIKIVDDRGRVRVYMDDPQERVERDRPPRDDDD